MTKRPLRTGENRLWSALWANVSVSFSVLVVVFTHALTAEWTAFWHCPEINAVRVLSLESCFEFSFALCTQFFLYFWKEKRDFLVSFVKFIYSIYGLFKEKKVWIHLFHKCLKFKLWTRNMTLGSRLRHDFWLVLTVCSVSVSGASRDT